MEHQHGQRSDDIHRCCAGGHRTRTVDQHQTLKDLVCGMNVDEQSPHSTSHGGNKYYFCSARCKVKFDAAPKAYLAAVSKPLDQHVPDSSPVGTIYTCPMHPEIRLDHPANCPKCGMALEPVIPQLDEEENPELVDFRRRFWWTLPLTVIVTVLAMFGHRLGWFETKNQTRIELILSIPVVLWAGWPFFVRGAQSVIHRSPNMWTLIGLGTGSAFVYSVVATVAPSVFPASFMSMGRVGVYFEAAVVIISLTLLGQMLELKARSVSIAMAVKKMSLLRMCMSAICCAFARAKKFPSMVW
jgi:P-type Cu+ transporter